MKIGYARVSTDEQDTAAQLYELGEAGCDRIIQEKASTGGKLPLRDQLIGELGQGDTLIVWRFDRLGRDARDLHNILADLNGRGVELRSIRDGIDTRTPTGRAMFGMTSVFAQFERDILRERTKAGIAAARKAGRHVGRPPALTTAQIEHAAELLKQPEHSLRSVARLFNVSRSTIMRAVDRNKPNPP